MKTEARKNDDRKPSKFDDDARDAYDKVRDAEARGIKCDPEVGEQMMKFHDDMEAAGKLITDDTAPAAAIKRMLARKQPRNIPVTRNPLPGKTPEERGCCVHPFPTRAQRRQADRMKRRTYGEGKLSGKSVQLRYVRGCFERREARRKYRIARGDCPSCGYDAALWSHDDCDVKHPTIEHQDSLVKKVKAAGAAVVDSLVKS
jgi:hypothetical protein